MPDQADPNDLTSRVRRALSAGRERVTQAATQGRVELERRRLQRDLDAFWTRLGRVTYHLAKGGEVSHPEIDRTIAWIEDLERKLTALGEPDSSETSPESLASDGQPR